MLIGARTAAWGLPYDREVEYLQGDGNAYIDTLIPVVNGLCFNLKTSIEDGGAVVPVCGIGVTNERCYIRATYDTGIENRVSVSFGVWWTNFRESFLGDHEFTLTNLVANSYAKMNIDGTEYIATGKTTTYTGNYTFNAFRSQGVASGSNVRIKKIRLYVTDGLYLFDAIPVVKNNVGYMYDKVSSKLFGNAASSGAFTWGELSA